MSKNTNLSFLTDFLTADIVNSRVGMNNVSPQSTFDVTGTGKFSGILTLGSTVSNGTYTYTLPSATGTLALTSDIPSVSGYVPYTGATQAVNLGYNQLLASTLSINGDSLTGGSYLGFKHSTSVNTGNSGYTSIYTFGTNLIGFKSISGATTRDFSFSMASITAGVADGRTYTLPDADGTIALTSAIPANPVGGTGTTNYLPKFTGASAIGNSLVFDDGTNVGINNNIPTNKLTINNNGNSFIAFRINDTNANASFISVSVSNIDAGIIANGISGIPLDFYTGGSIKTRLTSGGNLLVGTTTDAGFKLDVNGTGRFINAVLGGTGSAFADGLRINRNSNTNQYTVINHLGGATNIVSVDQSGNNIAEIYFSRSINGSTITNSMMINASGSVGIGTTSPPSKLSVQFDKSVAFSGLGVYDSQAYNVSNHGGTVTFGGTFNSGGSYTEWSAIGGMKSNTTDGNISGDINFYTRLNSSAMTEQMRITSGGNVLINTTSDIGERLTLNGRIGIVGATVASGNYRSFFVRGSQNVADDATLTINVTNTSLIFIAENNTGTGALFFCGYVGATITKISDPSNMFDTADTDGKLCIFKSAGSDVATVRNRLGSTKNITVSYIGVSD